MTLYPIDFLNTKDVPVTMSKYQVNFCAIY